MFRLPPLNALRAFEVAARHESIKRAAAELRVTPSAVTRHVQCLEKYLAVKLFERRNREMELTPIGRQYMLVLNDALGRIDAATARVAGHKNRPHIHIMSPVTFTMRWLVPRLPSFHRDNPNVDVRFTTTLGAVDFVADKIDIAIRATPLNGDNLQSHLLFETDLIPVCSPDLLSSGPPLRKISDLQRHTLIRSSGRPEDWASWLKAVNNRTIDPMRGIVFETSSLAYQAALQGLGVVLAQRAFVSDEIAAGRLVIPLDLPLRGHSKYFMTYRAVSPLAQPLKMLRNWLLERAENSQTPSLPLSAA